MSDKSLEEDAVPSIKSQGSIPFSPEIMRTLVDTCRKQKVQLKGLANIQNLVQVKEEELTAAKEKITNLTAALDKSEIRQANLIRLLGNGGRSPGQSVSTSGDYAFSAVSLQRRTQTGSCSLNSKLQYSDIEEDGAGPTIAEDCQTFSGIPSVSALKSDCKSSIRGRLEADACTFEEVPPLTLSENNFMSGASACLPSNCFTLDPLAFPDSRSKLPSCSSMQPSFNSAPGVSKDLLDKIVQQNVRLKKATREILNQRGMSLNSYLVKFSTFFI